MTVVVAVVLVFVFSSPYLSCFQLEKEQGAGIGQAVGGGVGGGKKEQKGKKSPGNYHRGERSKVN